MMEASHSTIPYYKEINDFLESISPDYRTRNPELFCLRLKENEGSITNYKPPFRKDFYFVALVSNAGETRITYDNTNVTQLNSFLVFQSPGLLYSFYRDNTANGYLLYFKKECLSFFKPDIVKEFPFFNLLHTNFFKLNHNKFREFAPHFEDVFKAYENASDNQHKVASIKLLALLYQLKEFTNAFKQWEEGFTTPQQIILQKYIQLVNNFYLEKRTIEEYAAILNVTSNYLSQSVKKASGKNASGFINDRILAEAKSLIRFTQLDIAEIAYQLNFTDPANFGKFFKKNTDQTPLAFRKQAAGM
jgi:AraC family transcriptional regulator, transcriptional activator of pobA